MDDQKKMQDKANKAIYPKEDKAPPPTPPQMGPQQTGAGERNVERGVRIKLKPGRKAEGVTVEADGTASVDAKTAERLVSIGYAEIVEQ